MLVKNSPPVLTLPDGERVQLPREDFELSAQERYIKALEKDDKLVQKYRMGDQESFKNVEFKMGRRMTHQEFIRRVLHANPELWVEDSNYNPQVVGFYRKRAKPLVDHLTMQTVLEAGTKESLAANFEKGWLPEFSYIYTDAADLPVKEVRGWRTVLIRLLKNGAISWQSIVENFGDATGANSKHWQSMTRRFKSA